MISIRSAELFGIRGNGVSKKGLAVLNKILNILDKLNCLRLKDEIKIKKPDIST